MFFGAKYALDAQFIHNRLRINNPTKTEPSLLLVSIFKRFFCKNAYFKKVLVILETEKLQIIVCQISFQRHIDQLLKFFYRLLILAFYCMYVTFIKP